MPDLIPVPSSRRGKPGRPRTGDQGIFGGHNLGTGAPKPQASSGDGSRAQVQQTIAPVVPRLLDLHAAASYLGISEWTVRTLEEQGILGRVRIPLSGRGELRKLLFDREDLDHMIAAWKDENPHA